MAQRIPDGQDLQLNEQPRRIPSAPAVPSEGAVVEPMQGADITAAATTPIPPLTSEQELMPGTAESLVNTQQPIPFRPIHYTLPSVPDFLTEQQPTDLEQLQQFNDSIQTLEGINDVYSVGQLRNRLRSTFNLNRHSATLAPTDRGMPSEMDVSIEQANTRRALQTQNTLVAPNAERGLVGVVRSLQSGQPFNAASNQSVRDFFLTTLGLDIAITQQEREPTEEPSFVDRALSGAASAASATVPGLAGILGMLLTPSAQDTGAARRILREVGRITHDRVQRRVEEVGVGGFAAETAFGAFTGPSKTVENVARNIRRQYGTPSAAVNSTLQNASFGIVGFENGRPVLGTGDLAGDRENFEPFESTDTEGVNVILQRAVGLTPRQIELGAQDRQGVGAIPIDSTFVGELVNRSADFRNLLRDLEPVINEAGQVGFNPFAGHFGEFGSAGSLSALLWLANLPEGVVTGALYDITDLGRAITYDTRVGRLLGRVNPIFNEPLLDTATRIDTLGAFVGRDYGFTQRFSEDRYLSFIGNPGLRFVPKPIQIAAGFIADAAVGGFTDAGFTDPVFDFITGATRRVTRQVAEETVDTVGAALRRQIDEVVSRNAADVIRRSNSADNQVIDLLGRRINNTVRSNEIPDQARVLLPDVETVARRFNLDSAEPYSLRTAIRRGGDFEQLEIPFVRPRLVGEVAEAIGTATDIQPVFSVTRRLRRADEQLENIQRLINTETARLQVAEEGAEQLSLILENHEQSLRNTVSEQLSLLRTATPEEVNGYIVQLLNRTVRNGDVEITPNGFVIQEAANEVFDTLAPTVPFNQVTPRTTRSTTETLFQYRVDPDSVSDVDIALIRRNDRTLQELASIWNVEGEFAIPDTPINELSNLYRATALAKDYPTLLTRIGKPISGNIESPIKRVDFSSQADVPYSLSAVVEAREAPRAEVLPVTQQRRRLVSLQNRAGRIVSDIQKNLYEGRVDKVLDLEQQLDRVTAATNKIFADNPDLAIEQVVRSLPDNTAPVGRHSNALRDRYILAERRFHYETDILRRMRADLSDVDSLVRQQQDVVARLPQLERFSPASELATRRREGLSTRTATGEVNQPGPEFTIPELSELVGSGESLRNLSRTEQLQDFTEEQIRQAVRNSPELDFDPTSQEFVIRVDEPVADVGRFDAFEPLVDIEDPAPGTFIVDFDEPYVLERASRTIANRNDSQVTISFPNNTELALGRQNNNLFIDFFVQGTTARPGGARDTRRALGVRRGLSEMKNYLDSFMRTNPTYDYVVGGIGGTQTRISNQLRDALGRNEPLSLELSTELVGAIGEKYSKYKQYYKYGFRLLEGGDGIQPLSIAEYTRHIIDGGTDEMFFDFDPRQGLRTTRNTGVQSDFYHGTKSTSLDAAASSTTNELGPGLYLSSDINVARRHARSSPAEDLIDVGSLTPRMSNRGRIFPVSIPDIRVVSFVDDIQPAFFNAIDIRTANDDLIGTARQAFSDTIRELIPEISNRWRSWSNNHPDMAEWWHYIRSQYLRLRGPDSLDEYTDFTRRIQQEMLDVGIDGLKDGDTLVVINPEKMFVRPVVEDETATGSVAEGLLNRYAADLELHNRVKNSTSEAILESDRLAIDQYTRNRLADAVAEQERVALRTTQAFNEMTDRMERSVNIDRANNVANQINDANRDSVNTFNRVNRTPNLPTECP